MTYATNHAMCIKSSIIWSQRKLAFEWKGRIINNRDHLFNGDYLVNNSWRCFITECCNMCNFVWDSVTNVSDAALAVYQVLSVPASPSFPFCSYNYKKNIRKKKPWKPEKDYKRLLPMIAQLFFISYFSFIFKISIKKCKYYKYFIIYNWPMN